MLFWHNINTHAHVHTQAELSLLWTENVPCPCCSTRFRAAKELTFLLEKAWHTFTSGDPFCASAAAHAGQPGPRPGPEEAEGTRGPERVWREHPLRWGSLPVLPGGNFHSWCQLNSVNSLPPGKHPDWDGITGACIKYIQKKLKLYTVRQGETRAKLSGRPPQLLTEEGEWRDLLVMLETPQLFFHLLSIYQIICVPSGLASDLSWQY